YYTKKTHYFQFPDRMQKEILACRIHSFLATLTEVMATAPSTFSRALQSIRKLSHWCNTFEALLILLLTLFVLRIPNLAEPYWYGDEAIYLTIGTALRAGGELYATIV